MALLVVSVAALLALAGTAVHVAGQPGFLSIDCGLDASSNGYISARTSIEYVPDGPYVDGGENHRVSDGAITEDTYQETLRSFPSGERNCYTLPTESGSKYLVRMEFLYGNYDGENSSSLEFDLHLGTNYWDTAAVSLKQGHCFSEAMFIAWESRVQLCLVNTGEGTPFVSSVELRRVEPEIYQQVTADLSLSFYERQNMGTDTTTRYSTDQYDRIWGGSISNPLWRNISTQATIVSGESFELPGHVLQTAITTLVNNDTVLRIKTWQDSKPSTLMVFLHFADFQNGLQRQFNAYINGDLVELHTPSYLVASCVYSSVRSTDGKYNITLAAAPGSVLPPILNAYEIYTLVKHDTPMTFLKDVDAIMSIKLEYGVKKNWMGDPCFPSKYGWDGVKCSNTSGNIWRITSLDLSNSNLAGAISNNFSLLTALEDLNLSGNNLTGPMPDSLCKNAGSLIIRYDSNKDMCNSTVSPSPSKTRTAIISTSVVVPILVGGVLLSYFIWRGKSKISIHYPPEDPEPQSVPGRTKVPRDDLLNTENRRFTYKELEKFTNMFERSIGQGGFGLVYYGCLEDDTEIAVKVRSESSSHGLDEFLAEVQSLSKVHHRNLVSLVGYCWEKDHLALVYEYMSRGNLCDHLRGKNGVSETMSWGTRVRIVLEAAQGLDYLHNGCRRPVIHRDVKTSNILLGQNLQAKLADFGLCKTYISDTQSHISTNAAGSDGYYDPEYYYTGRLAESSDVYSFGVVLMEVVTGEPPILPSHGHIIERMKQKIATGNISSVADTRLGGTYDVSSMWKVIDTAMACTSDDAARRPTIDAVVVQLKESLALEEAREYNGGRVSPKLADNLGLMSTFGPSAR